MFRDSRRMFCFIVFNKREQTEFFQDKAKTLPSVSIKGASILSTSNRTISPAEPSIGCCTLPIITVYSRSYKIAFCEIYSIFFMYLLKLMSSQLQLLLQKLNEAPERRDVQWNKVINWSFR